MIGWFHKTIWRYWTKIRMMDFMIFYQWFIFFFKENPTIDYDKSFIGQKNWYSRFKDNKYKKMKRYDGCQVEPCHKNWISCDTALFLEGLLARGDERLETGYNTCSRVTSISIMNYNFLIPCVRLWAPRIQLPASSYTSRFFSFPWEWEWPINFWLALPFL